MIIFSNLVFGFLIIILKRRLFSATLTIIAHVMMFTENKLELNYKILFL